MNDTAQARLSLQADARAMMTIRAFLATFACEHGIGGDDSARVAIAVEELVTNLIKYGYAADAPLGSLAVALRLEGDRLHVEIIDDGHEFDPFAPPPPDLGVPLETMPVGKLGLHLVKSLMEETRYRRDGSRNVTEIARRVVRASGAPRRA